MSGDDELLPQRIERLGQKADQISQALVGFQELALAHTKRQLEAKAHYSALVSIVTELAQCHGISPAQFQEHYEARRAYFHDKLLQHAETVDVQMASKIDARTLSEVPTGQFPPLFPSE